MQQSSEDDEDIEEQDGMVLVNVATPAQPASPIHPASDRNSGHVSSMSNSPELVYFIPLPSKIEPQLTNSPLFLSLPLSHI